MWTRNTSEGAGVVLCRYQFMLIKSWREVSGPCLWTQINTSQTSPFLEEKKRSSVGIVPTSDCITVLRGHALKGEFLTWHGNSVWYWTCYSRAGEGGWYWCASEAQNLYNFSPGVIDAIKCGICYSRQNDFIICPVSNSPVYYEFGTENREPWRTIWCMYHLLQVKRWTILLFFFLFCV